MTVFIAWVLALGFFATLVAMLVVLGILYREFLRREPALEELDKKLKEIYKDIK